MYGFAGVPNLVSWLYEVPGMEYPRVASLDGIQSCDIVNDTCIAQINDRHTCQVCTKSRVCALKPRYANKCNCDANVLKLEPPSLSKCRCSGDQGSRPPLTRGSLASSATVKIVQIKKHAVGELDLRRLLCSALQVGAAARLDPSQLARGLLLASSAYSSAAGSACYFSAL